MLRGDGQDVWAIQLKQPCLEPCATCSMVTAATPATGPGQCAAQQMAHRTACSAVTWAATGAIGRRHRLPQHLSRLGQSLDHAAVVQAIAAEQEQRAIHWQRGEAICHRS
jgi:hypothetical protein